jgi:hypothetical protein
MISRKVAKDAKEIWALSITGSTPADELPVGPLFRRAVAEKA